jgi:hypothetical protein
MRRHSHDPANGLLFIPMARTDDGQLRSDIRRMGLGTAAPVYARPGDDRQLKDVARYFRISAMIVAIQALSRNSGTRQPIDVFISYARRDGEEVADQLRQAFARYPGVTAIVDSMAFSHGVSVDGTMLEQRLSESTCVVILQTASYANREWCRREALLAKRSDVPMIVVEMLDGLERRSLPSLTNCPHFRTSGQVESHLEEIVELAVAESLRIAHHRARSVATLVTSGIDPHRVEILVRTPEFIRLVDLVASNDGAVRQGRLPRDLVLYPDPPLVEDELRMLRMVDPNFQFLTPSTVLLNTAGTEIM